ncbi:hypothetical protein [Risungbinella massiliensis]|uniref:hypothetical protein n=1 Tax=Risungbinella massiliensis TaxID=1329796 RepID=UPI0005CC61A4|nr:hypothetical protein [Risungbinella massiliensis]
MHEQDKIGKEKLGSTQSLKEDLANIPDLFRGFVYIKETVTHFAKAIEIAKQVSGRLLNISLI